MLVVKRKRKFPESTYIQQESPKKMPKLDEDLSTRTEPFGVSEKIKSDKVIPVLQSLIGNILEHKDPSKILSSDIDIIENCMEQVITKDIPVDILIECNIGLLLKDFYDFVHLCSNLKVLDTITRCAFKRLKKRTCEKLFGEKETLNLISEERASDILSMPEDIIKERLRAEDYKKVNAEIDKVHTEELMQIKERKRKRRIIKKSMHTYNLRQAPKKTKKRSISRKKSIKPNAPPPEPKKEDKVEKVNEEVKKSDHWRKNKKVKALIEELTSMLKKVSSTLITRIEKNKRSGRDSAKSGERYKKGRSKYRKRI